LSGLVPGTTYTFTVVADNGHSGWMGTGEGTAAESSTAVPTRSSAPGSLLVRPGDRAIGVSWTRPVNQGATSVSGYDLSVNGGRSWRRVRPVPMNGRLSTRVLGVRNGTAYSVKVRARNAAGPGLVSQARTRTAQWFRDPLSPATRSRQVAVPRLPNSYRGPLRHTRATARSHDGTLAMSGTSLHARQLQSGQAATVRYGPLFGYNSSVLSAKGRNQVKSMVRSLTYVKAVTCEGNSDYGGRKKWEAMLARQRAAVVCQALRSYGAKVTTTVRGYGSNKPVTVGGSRAQRADNRRVVVRITRG
jgi:outer membrane protein OmpA-like peptidoglycan-associated protein